MCRRVQRCHLGAGANYCYLSLTNPGLIMLVFSFHAPSVVHGVNEFTRRPVCCAMEGLFVSARTSPAGPPTRRRGTTGRHWAARSRPIGRFARAYRPQYMLRPVESCQFGDRFASSAENASCSSPHSARNAPSTGSFSSSRARACP